MNEKTGNTVPYSLELDAVRENFPDVLLHKNTWVCWKYERVENKKTGEVTATKRPYNPKTGRYASSKDPDTWGTFEEAVNFSKQNPVSGVGFMLDAEKSPSGPGYIVIDLDHIQGKKWQKEADTIVKKFGTYSEVSPSGDGVHMWAQVEDRAIITKNKLPVVLEGKRHQVEIYTAGRFMTVTGKHIPESPSYISTEKKGTAAVEWLFSRMPEKPRKTTGAKVKRQYKILTDEEVMDAAQNDTYTPRREKFKALWETGTSSRVKSSDDSQSGQDMALANLLCFYTGGNEEQMERLFLQSECGARIERKKGHESDYLQRTITKAIKNWDGKQYISAKKYSKEYFDNLDREQLISRENILDILAITDAVERAHVEAVAGFRAKELSIAREFQKMVKAYKQEKAMQTAKSGQPVSEKTTNFSGQPFALRCGDWKANDNGVARTKWRGEEPVLDWAARCPIMPREILANKKTGTQKVKVMYKNKAKNRWEYFTVPRAVLANHTKITALSNYGVPVDSKTAKALMEYFSDCMALNPDILPQMESVDHLGWTETGFLPYSGTEKIDCEEEYKPLIHAVASKGCLGEWLSIIRPLLDNIYLRLTLAASLASPLIKPLHALPFIFHLYGGTEAGKTVGLMVAASVWGEPSKKGLLLTMNNTVNYCMNTAYVLQDIPFFGDEMQTIKEMGRENNYDSFIYRVTEGKNRGRMKADGTTEPVKSWANCFLTTGEEPMGQANSGGGAQNRLLEIDCTGHKVVDNGHAVVVALSAQYGTLGPAYIAKLQEKQKEGMDLVKAFEQYRGEIVQKDIPEKQAASMALLMVADDFFRQYFLSASIPALTVSKVIPFLKKKKDIDVSERAYSFLVDRIEQNPGKFYRATESASTSDCDKPEFSPLYGAELWGKIEGNIAYINQTVCRELLSKEGFSLDAVKNKWSQTQKLALTPQGRFVFRTSVSGKKFSAYKILLPI